MESALDVLSRAASIVETNDKNAQDPLYKGLPLPPPPPPPLDRSSLDHSPSHLEVVDHRSSPGKELPTKLRKDDRHAERFELTKPLGFDKDHVLQHQRRQELLASRTSRRSVTPEPYRNGETTRPSEQPTYSIPPHHPGHHQLIPQSLSSRNTPPPPHHHGPPPRYPGIQDYSAPHDGPLNLSITNTNSNSADPSPSSQSRPSVITCANTTSSVATANGRYDNGGSGSSSPSSREVSSEIVDPAIEEHFRRSLGKNYSEIVGKQPSDTPSPPPLSRSVPSMHVASTQSGHSSPTLNSPAKQNPANVSITGSVDDHFARALGDKWSVLQNKKDPKMEVLSPGSVDDHFAKALGDTWLRIKAERESPRGPPPPFGGPHQLSPHPLTHLPHPHSLPHPIPPRPSSPSSQSHNASLLST